MPTLRKRTSPTGHTYWEAGVQVGGVRRWVTGRTRREAEEKLARLLAAGRLTRPPGLTLQEWWSEWLEGRDLRPHTRVAYTKALRPVLAQVGDLRLDKLTPTALAAVFVRLRGQHGSRLLQHAYDALRACLNAAVRAGLLPANPLQAVPRPRHEPKERPVWGPAEVRTFLQVCAGSHSRYAPLLALAVLTGCRVGELLGLTWADLDREAGTLTVQRQVTWVRGRPVVGPPKSPSGRRTIALPTQAWAWLDRLPQTGPALFPQASPSGLRNALLRLCRRAGLPPVSVHDLRATHATLLAALGLEVRVLQHRLGHSDPRVTIKHYSRLLRDAERRAAEALERALGE